MAHRIFGAAFQQSVESLSRGPSSCAPWCPECVWGAFLPVWGVPPSCWRLLFCFVSFCGGWQPRIDSSGDRTARWWVVLWARPREQRAGPGLDTLGACHQSHLQSFIYSRTHMCPGPSTQVYKGLQAPLSGNSTGHLPPSQLSPTPRPPLNHTQCHISVPWRPCSETDPKLW